jgi:hypothetical protein
MDDDTEGRKQECPLCGSEDVWDCGYEMEDMERLLLKMKCEDCEFEWLELWGFGMSLAFYWNRGV